MRFAIIALLLAASLSYGQTRRRVIVVEETEVSPPPVVTEERVYVRSYAPAPLARVRVVETVPYVPAPVEIRRGPLGLRSDIRYSNGATVRYGLFGRVRVVR